MDLLKKLQIRELNEMQKQTLEESQKSNDVMVLSPTGSGKTLAFLLSVFKNLKKDFIKTQAIVIVPTRELALQVETVFKKITNEHKVTVCYGGHNKKTEQNNLIEPPILLIGTPGRIIDHIADNNLNTNYVNFLVLDEFDKCLELGFTAQIEKIISHLPNLKQQIFTSATELNPFPKNIKTNQLKSLNFLKDNLTKPDLTFKKVISEPEEKLNAVFNLLCKIGNKKTIVFCNHRDAVDRISETLAKKGIVHEMFHGGMNQDDRERAIFKFKNESAQILITTDLAARGIDIAEIESIIHYQIPTQEADFIHRNGRTARMKARGNVYIMVTNSEKYDFITEDILTEDLSKKYALPKPPKFQTLYISAGKKDKVNKVDIVGFFLKKGNLENGELGLIEVKDTTAYVAVLATKCKKTISALNNQKLKNKKVRIDIAK